MIIKQQCSSTLREGASLPNLKLGTGSLRADPPWTCLAHYLLTEPRKNMKNTATSGTVDREAAQQPHLDSRLPEQASGAPENILTELCADAASIQASPAKKPRYIPQGYAGHPFILYVHVIPGTKWRYVEMWTP